MPPLDPQPELPKVKLNPTLRKLVFSEREVQVFLILLSVASAVQASPLVKDTHTALEEDSDHAGIPDPSDSPVSVLLSFSAVEFQYC